IGSIWYWAGIGGSMAKKRKDEHAESPDGLDRVLERLGAAPAGLHDVSPPARSLPDGLPAPLIELYARSDGMRLYLDTLVIAPSGEPARSGEHWVFGTLDD